MAFDLFDVDRDHLLCLAELETALATLGLEVDPAGAQVIVCLFVCVSVSGVLFSVDVLWVGVTC